MGPRLKSTRCLDLHSSILVYIPFPVLAVGSSDYLFFPLFISIILSLSFLVSSVSLSLDLLHFPGFSGHSLFASIFPNWLDPRQLSLDLLASSLKNRSPGVHCPRTRNEQKGQGKVASSVGANNHYACAFGPPFFSHSSTGSTSRWLHWRFFSPFSLAEQSCAFIVFYFTHARNSRLKPIGQFRTITHNIIH